MGALPMKLLFVIYILIAAFVFCMVAFRGPYIAKKARAKVLAEPWIDARDLVKDWAKKESQYRNGDGLGCYLMIVFDHEVTDGNYEGFIESYVGKANKAYKGAYAQLPGHGIDELAQDYKDPSRFIYVQARFYDKDDVDKMQRTLVGSLKSHKSYNTDIKL